MVSDEAQSSRVSGSHRSALLDCGEDFVWGWHTTDYGPDVENKVFEETVTAIPLELPVAAHPIHQHSQATVTETAAWPAKPKVFIFCTFLEKSVLTPDIML